MALHHPVATIKVAQRLPILELVRGPDAPRKFPLMATAVTIGRDPSADIPVGSQELSRKHLRISKVGEDFMCVDLDSANGSYLNGVKVHSAVLRDGDQLQLADVVFLFHGAG